VQTGTDVDLLSLPWPYIHQGDGGRYSNLHTVVAPDPEAKWGRWSSHRTMLHDDTQASLLLLAGEQVPNRYYYEYEPRDDQMPVAVVVGSEPAVECSTDMWIPSGQSEAAFAGGLKGDSVALVACETNDLYVPATAEVVIEGHIRPNDRLDEGPFGDYFGYMNGPRRSMPVFEVDAITHRPEPLLPFCVEGTGVGYGQNSTSTLQLAAAGPDATLGLRAAGSTSRWPSPGGSRHGPSGSLRRTDRTPATTTNSRTSSLPRGDAPYRLLSCSSTPTSTRSILERVLTAIALDADPDTDFHQFGVERMPKVPLNIYQTPDEKGSADVGTSKAKTAKAYIDATGDGQVQTASVDTRKRAQERLVDAGLPAERFDLLEGRDGKTR